MRVQLYTCSVRSTNFISEKPITNAGFSNKVHGIPTHFVIQIEHGCSSQLGIVQNNELECVALEYDRHKMFSSIVCCVVKLMKLFTHRLHSWVERIERQCVRPRDSDHELWRETVLTRLH